MSKYQQFIFKDYSFDPDTGLLKLHYAMDQALDLTETYRFNFEYTSYDPTVLDRAIQALFFLAGVSYYKMYIPPQIVIQKGQLDKQSADFFSKTYQRGLGEFWHVNNLNPRTPVNFPTNVDNLPVLDKHKGSGLLVAVGGGKDSLVSIEILRKTEPVTTWGLNHRPQLEPLVKQIGLPHAWVERAWDPQVQELNKQDAMNGHIPISGIFACVGTIVAILSGKRDVVMSNEQSANDPTLVYEGVEINHQYSKSQEFEKDYQAYLDHNFGQSIRYYSFLRPFSEVRISEIFAGIGFDKYKNVFSSCNRAFVHGSDHMSWCGECSKCAFVFLALTPFVPRQKLESIWSGKNLLLDQTLRPTYRKLLGLEGDKPLDCVGDVKESRAAMREAFKIYPELENKYQFDIPVGYEFRALSSHEIPEEIYRLLDT